MSINPPSRDPIDWEAYQRKVDRRSHIRRFWPLYVLLILVMLCGGVVASVAAAGTGLRNAAERHATSTSTGTATPPQKASEGPQTTFGDGTWLVNNDIKPGTYQATVPADAFGCYWARLRNNDADPIVENKLGSPGARMTVTIRKTDFSFETSGCGKWVKK